MPDNHSNEAIESTVLELVAKKLGKSPKEVDHNTGFIQLGIESIAMIELIEELEAKYGQLPPTLLFDYPDIESVVNYLSQKNKG